MNVRGDKGTRVADTNPLLCGGNKETTVGGRSSFSTEISIVSIVTSIDRDSECAAEVVRFHSNT